MIDAELYARHGSAAIKTTLRIEDVGRWDGVRSFFGWRWDVKIFAWDEEEKRFRPAPFVMHGSFVYWILRARTYTQAVAMGNARTSWLKEKHRASLERQAAVEWR